MPHRAQSWVSKLVECTKHPEQSFPSALPLPSLPSPSSQLPFPSLHPLSPTPLSQLSPLCLSPFSLLPLTLSLLSPFSPLLSLTVPDLIKFLTYLTRDTVIQLRSAASESRHKGSTLPGVSRGWPHSLMAEWGTREIAWSRRCLTRCKKLGLMLTTVLFHSGLTLFFKIVCRLTVSVKGDVCRQWEPPNFQVRSASGPCSSIKKFV